MTEDRKGRNKANRRPSQPIELAPGLTFDRHKFTQAVPESPDQKVVYYYPIKSKAGTSYLLPLDQQIGTFISFARHCGREQEAINELAEIIEELGPLAISFIIQVYTRTMPPRIPNTVQALGRLQALLDVGQSAVINPNLASQAERVGRRLPTLFKGAFGESRKQRRGEAIEEANCRAVARYAEMLKPLFDERSRKRRWKPTSTSAYEWAEKIQQFLTGLLPGRYEYEYKRIADKIKSTRCTNPEQAAILIRALETSSTPRTIKNHLRRHKSTSS